MAFGIVDFVLFVFMGVFLVVLWLWIVNCWLFNGYGFLVVVYKWFMFFGGYGFCGYGFLDVLK